MLSLKEIKQELRNGEFAFPGAYPKFFTMGDGEALSFAAARDMFREIAGAHIRGELRSDWAIYAVSFNWEDGALYCAHSGKRIPSAYAEPEEDSDNG